MPPGSAALVVVLALAWRGLVSGVARWQGAARADRPARSPCLPGQASVAEKAGIAGQASVAEKAGVAGQASVAEKAGVAGQAGVAVRAGLARPRDLAGCLRFLR
jgi:hypothetical protein